MRAIASGGHRPVRFVTEFHISRQRELLDCVSAFQVARGSDPHITLSIIADAGIADPLLSTEAPGVSVARVAAGEGWRLLSEHDALLLPTYLDVLPVMVLEAAAAGLPLITSNTPIAKSVFTHRQTALLVAAGDIDALSATILEVTSNRELRSNLARSSQELARQRFGGSLFAGRQAYGYVAATASASRGRLKKYASAVIPQRMLRWQGEVPSQQFALTFDDGPDPVYTPKILSILRRHQARSTFFMIGNRIEECPGMVEQMEAEGHEVANHSYSHSRFELLSFVQARKELLRTDRLLGPNRRRKFFRPPFGNLTGQCAFASWSTGHQIVMWNVDLKDYCATSAAEIEAKVASRPTRGGDIILYHGTNDHAIKALPTVLEAARRMGLSPVPVSKLLA